MAVEIDYDFIKTEEAKKIYIVLESKRMLKEDCEYDLDIDSIIGFKDEEKKKMVERFIFEATVPYQLFENIEKKFIDLGYRRVKSLLNSAMELKMKIDPDYIYEKWLVETRALRYEFMWLRYNDEDPLEYLMDAWGDED